MYICRILLIYSNQYIFLLFLHITALLLKHLSHRASRLSHVSAREFEKSTDTANGKFRKENSLWYRSHPHPHPAVPASKPRRMETLSMNMLSDA
jgi:hypothetical protein